MKKLSLTKISMIISVLFIFCTILTLLIIYMDIEGSLVLPFLIGYLIFTLLSLIYLIVVILMGMKTLGWLEVRKLMLKFFAYLIVLSCISYVINYGFTLTKIDFYEILPTSLGFSAVLTFSDLIFLKKKQVQ